MHAKVEINNNSNNNTSVDPINVTNDKMVYMNNSQGKISDFNIECIVKTYSFPENLSKVKVAGGSYQQPFLRDGDSVFADFIFKDISSNGVMNFVLNTPVEIVDRNLWKVPLENSFKTHLESKLEDKANHSGECAALFEELFTSQVRAPVTSRNCSNENAPVAMLSGANLTCPPTVGEAPKEKCNSTTGYNSIDLMDSACECEFVASERRVDPTTQGIKYYCQQDLGSENNLKTYEVFVKFEVSDNCNQLTADGGNLKPINEPIEIRLSEPPTVGQNLPDVVNCARVHGNQTCGIVSASPIVLGYRVVGDPTNSDGEQVQHQTLNHDFCGTNPPPSLPPQGDTCSLTGAVINGDCHANRIVRCAHNTDNGNYYYCTDEKSSGTYQWLNCSSDSTCGGRKP